MSPLVVAVYGLALALTLACPALLYANSVQQRRPFRPRRRHRMPEPSRLALRAPVLLAAAAAAAYLALIAQIGVGS